MGRIHLREVSWWFYLDINWVSQKQYMEHVNLEILNEAARVIQSIYLRFSWPVLAWEASNSHQREIAWKQGGTS